jgi:anti-sigma28 factor (negative regulator of flagellin synthesis)
MRLIQIQEQIGRGEYHVDSHAVADAIVRRLMEQHKTSLPEHKRVQGECS